MSRVYVIAEGSTEESFLNDVVAPVLWPVSVYLRPIRLGPLSHRGGNVNYARVKKHVITQLRQDRDAYCSTMLDFYGLGNGFPGMPCPPHLSNQEKVVHVERAIAEDLSGEVPDLRPEVRFLPYLQLHEYEGLLFSDPASFAAAIRKPTLAEQFERIRREVDTPEDINNDPISAPSKRVLRLHSSYRKVLDGVTAAKAVGLACMRRECAHFRTWIERLESLA